MVDAIEQHFASLMILMKAASQQAANAGKSAV
jgi:hypothetical protein